METLMKNAVNGKGSMPPRGGDGSLSDADLKKAIVYMLKESGQKVAAEDDAPAEEKAGDKTEDKAAESSAAAATAVASAKATEIPGGGAGEETYKSACASCHDTGVAGAPKLGDKAAWADRIAAGADTLYQSAINGKGGMPPKGGRADLSDDAIRSAVDYMVGSSR